MDHNRGLGSRTRRRLVEHYKATGPHLCHLCGYTIPQLASNQKHPLALAVDELLPRSKGGSATDPTNTAPSHRWCNGARNNRPITPELQARCREAIEAMLAPRQTTRSW